MVSMEFYDVMRSTAAVREFTDDPLPDDVLARVLDHARFAPSGGNRQGVRVIVLRDKETRSALADLGLPAARRYTAQLANGESPWNPLQPTGVDEFDDRDDARRRRRCRLRFARRRWCW